jgi:hypothetical protein
MGWESCFPCFSRYFLGLGRLDLGKVEDIRMRADCRELKTKAA